MKIVAFTKCFILVGVALLTLPQISLARGGGHGGGGHFRGGHSGGFHGGRLPTARRHVRSTSHGVSRGSQARSVAGTNHSRAGGRLPVSHQTAQHHPGASSRTRLASQHSASSTTDRNGRTADAATNPQRATAAWSRDRSPQWHQAVDDRKAYWNRWATQNDRRVQQFQADRTQQWGRLDHFWRGRNVAQTYHGRAWSDYRARMAAFRDGRRLEVWNGVRDYHDNLFDDRWWAGCGWWPGAFIGVADPWWWWGACSWGTLTAFLNCGWSQPLDYDYEVNVVDQGDIVYVNGQAKGSTTQSEQQAVALANPQKLPALPAPNQGWTPLGVWALCQEEKGNADMFVQLSVNKTGQLSGAYTNVLSGEKAPVVGQIDKATQRIAFRLGTNANTVVEAGAYNLTQEVAGCRVYFGKAPPQTWLLVRLPAPKLPDTPTPVAATSTPASTGKPGSTQN